MEAGTSRLGLHHCELGLQLVYSCLSQLDVGTQVEECLAYGGPVLRLLEELLQLAVLDGRMLRIVVVDPQV